MDWIQTLSIILTVLGTAYYIHREIQTDIKTTNARIDSANARTDQLYEKFCSMQTDYNNKFAAMQTDYNNKFDKVNEKFYDILKEGKKS